MASHDKTASVNPNRKMREQIADVIQDWDFEQLMTAEEAYDLATAIADDLCVVPADEEANAR